MNQIGRNSQCVPEFQSIPHGWLQQEVYSYDPQDPRTVQRRSACGNYRINAGIVPADHWIHDPSMGGGRIIGEVCHSLICVCISLEVLCLNCLPHRMDDGGGLMDTVVISMAFRNGSTASLSYFQTGTNLCLKNTWKLFGSGNDSDSG